MHCDLILTGGIFMGRTGDAPILPGVTALAIGGGRILALGTDDDMLHLAGPDSQRINLGGRLVVPGFVDTHIHFYEWSLKRRDLQLDDVTHLEELLARVQFAAGNLPAGQWVMGQGWNETDWEQVVMPDRHALDSVAPDHPVLLWRCDLHLAVANSTALQLAGIDRDTADPPEGRIERDDHGEPTGILRELAINLIRKAVAPPEDDHLAQAFEDGASALHQLGITGIHDVRLMEDSDGARALQTFRKLEEEDRLTLRSWVTLPGHRLDQIIGLGLRSGFGGDILRLGHVKFFSDGGMGARTAWMIEPFLDAGCGMPLMDMEELAAAIDRADRAGLATMVHAVGDRANRELVRIFTDLRDERRVRPQPRPCYPHRIEHVQMIRPEDRDRLGELGLALCVTPCNMVLDINLIDTAVGAGGRYTYAFRQLIDSGAPVMFSSDCPVCQPAPLPAMHAAVTRQRPDGTPAGGWYPEARVSVFEALQAFTAVPAQVHKAHDLGCVEVGARADLAVLSRDILRQPAAAILETGVELTVFNGKVVHRLF